MREEAVRRRLDRLQFADAVDAATAAADDPLEADRQLPLLFATHVVHSSSEKVLNLPAW